MYLPGNYGYHCVDNPSGKNILLPLHTDLAYIMLDSTCEHAFLSDLISIKKYYQKEYQYRILKNDKFQCRVLFGKDNTVINFPELASHVPESKKNISENLMQEINTEWILNAAHAISVIYDLKYNSHTRSNLIWNRFDFMRSANKIGEKYGDIFGKELGSRLIRAIFLFTSQAEKYAYTMLLSNESSNILFDIGLWNVRVI